jgi:LmbE family N-acetylglucosaminyl deacetylase
VSIVIHMKAGATSPIETIIGKEYAFILAIQPGMESVLCGALIAEASARGRPPLVAVLTDGSRTGVRNSHLYSAEELAVVHERETRAAANALRLPSHRLLMLGLLDHTAPHEGLLFDRAVESIANVMWMRDCNIIFAPSERCTDSDGIAARLMALAVVERTSVGLVSYCDSETELSPSHDAHRFDLGRHSSAKASAISAHAALTVGRDPSAPEIYIRERPPR